MSGKCRVGVNDPVAEHRAPTRAPHSQRRMLSKRISVPSRSASSARERLFAVSGFEHCSLFAMWWSRNQIIPFKVEVAFTVWSSCRGASCHHRNPYFSSWFSEKHATQSASDSPCLLSCFGVPSRRYLDKRQQVCRFAHGAAQDGARIFSGAPSSGSFPRL